MEVFDLAAWAGSQTTAIGCLVGDAMDHGNTMLRLLLRVLIEPGASRLHDVRAPINISRVVEGSRKEQSGSFHDLLRPDGKTFSRPGQRHVAVVPAYLFVKPAGFQIQISNGAYVRGVRRRCRAGGRTANWKMQLRPAGRCMGQIWNLWGSVTLYTSKSSVQRLPSN